MAESQEGCPFCGSGAEGYAGCVDNAHILSQLLDYNQTDQYLSKFPGVDAMALQHPENVDHWALYLHLSRLRLILDEGVLWRYEYSPILHDIIRAWSADHEPVLAAPKPLHRGELTSQGLVSLTSGVEASEYALAWGKSVYGAYQCDTILVYPVVSTFLNSVLSV